MSELSPMMKADDGNIVQFWWDNARNEGASEKAGRPVFDKVAKIRITSPGMKNQEVTHEVLREFWQMDDEPKRNPRINQGVMDTYRRQFDAWERNAAEEHAGTPLSEIRYFDVATVASLKEMGFHTVEALAGAADTAVQFLGGLKWREIARNYLASAADQQPLVALSAENDALKKSVAEMQAKMVDLEKMLDDATKAETKSKKAA